tara:strand:- start:1425 stop:1730 length:306 start_codon:yes stop_codon:yes gene_type:complete
MFVMALSIIGLLSNIFNKRPGESDDSKNKKLLMNVLWIVIYHFVWSYLCKHKYYTTGWVLVLLPVFISIVVVSFVTGMASGVAQCDKLKGDISKISQRTTA